MLLLSKFESACELKLTLSSNKSTTYYTLIKVGDVDSMKSYTDKDRRNKDNRSKRMGLIRTRM